MKKYVILIVISILLLGCSNSFNKNDKPEYHLIRGMNKYYNNDKSGAMSEYLEAYKKTPKNPILLREMGFLYNEFGDTTNSIKFYEESLKYDSKNENAIKNLSYIYFLERDFDKSKEIIDTLVNSKIDIYALKIKGYIEFELGNYEESYNYLSKVKESELDGKYLDIMTEILIKLEKKAELYEFYKKGYEIFYKNSYFVKKYSYVLSDYLGENEIAEVALLRYLTEVSKEDDILIELSNILIKQKKYKAARESIALISDAYKKNKLLKELK